MFIYILITLYFISNAFITGLIIGKDVSFLKPFTFKTAIALVLGLCFMIIPFLVGECMYRASNLKNKFRVFKILKRAGKALSFKQKWAVIVKV